MHLKKLTKNSIPFYFNKAFSTFFSFVWVSLMIKKIGLDQYGIYVILLSLSSLFINLMDFRTNEATVYFLERKSKKSVLLLSFIVDLILLGLFISLAYFLSFPLHKYYLKGKTSVELLFLGIISTAPIIGYSTYMGFLQYSERFKSLNVIFVLPFFFKVLFLFLMSGEVTLKAVIWITVASHLTVFSFTTYSLLGEIGNPFRIFSKEIDKNYVKTFFSYSTKSFISTTLKVGHENIEKIFLGYFLPPVFVGIYEILIKLSMMAIFFYTPISNVLFPSVNRQLRENKKIEKKMFLNTTVFSFAATLGAASIIFLFRNLILHLLNVDLTGIEMNISFLLLLVLLQKVLYSLGWWTRIFPLSLGKPEYLIYSHVFQLIIIPPLSLVIIPLMGLYGAIIVKYVEFVTGILVIGFLMRNFLFPKNQSHVKT